MVQEAVSGSFDSALQISLAGNVADALRIAHRIRVRQIGVRRPHFAWPEYPIKSQALPMNNLWQSDKLVSKLFSLAAEAVLQARTVMLFLQGKNALLVRLLGIQEMKDY